MIMSDSFHSGSQALQRCGSGCPAQTSCVGGLCCPLPVCASTGQVASSLCGPSSSCPSGQYCNGVACCVLPVCPSGGTAIQSCVQGTECPSGYGCSSGGGCCPLVNVADVVCPIASYPICQCSSTSLCPTGSSCYPSATPTCCAASPTVLMAVPGVPCEASPQCSGYSNGASCYQNLCVCLKGSFSNGASCVYQDPIVIEMAHSGCDQFGTPCRFVLSAARRRPLLSSNKNTTAEPLWFNVSGERRCPRDLPEADNTCLPSETCVDGVCKTRLWPGEYGCSSDAECTSRCPNTYCEQKSDKNLPQCQCKSGMLLYGRCFDVCPRGFHESGAYCQHDNEDAFWADPAAQQEIQTLLNNGVC
ncbi:EB module [Aphelenchoides fujianensis]|nr:EB module [Aphelenchoides fujianensis]